MDISPTYAPRFPVVTLGPRNAHQSPSFDFLPGRHPRDRPPAGPSAALRQAA